MLKLLGALIVFATFCEAGRRKAQKLSDRVKDLLGLEDGLIIMQNEISGLMSTLPEAVSKAACCSPIFIKVSENLSAMSPKEAFEKASEVLEKDERRIIMSFASGLLADDAQGQLRNISVCRERLSMVRDKAEKKRDALSKLYTAAGALAGAAVVIILL